MTEYMIKSGNSEKLDDKSISEIKELQSKLDFLIKGGTIKKDDAIQKAKSE